MLLYAWQKILLESNRMFHFCFFLSVFNYFFFSEKYIYLFGQKTLCLIKKLSVKNNSNQNILSFSFILLLRERSVVSSHAPQRIGIFCHRRQFMREFSKYFLWDLKIGKKILRTRFAGSRSLSSSGGTTPGYLVIYVW